MNKWISGGRPTQSAKTHAIVKFRDCAHVRDAAVLLRLCCIRERVSAALGPPVADWLWNCAESRITRS
jgi:hypothetical protein